VLDEQGVIVAVNNAWRQFAKENSLFEVSQDMLGVNYLDVCKNAVNQPYGDEASVARTGIMAVLAGEQDTFNLEYPCHSPNQQRWFQMKVSPLQGSRRGAVVSHENITERKLAERVLVQLKAMIDISLDGFWIVDLKGNLLQVNEAYAKISGYSVDELLLMPISQLEVTEGSEQIKTHIAKVVAQGYDLFETRHRHKDGHIIDIEISVAFLPEFQHFCVFCRDITQRKQIEDKLNAIFNASVEGIITIDLSGTIVSVNAAVETIFGYKPEELMAWTINKLMPSSPKEMTDSRLPGAVKCAGQIQEIEGIHKNGSVVPLDLSIAEYSIDNTRYFTYIVRDVSLRKHREQQDKEHLDQLAHVTRLGLMGEMASGIAHEVNQPLTAISSYTQVSLNLINSEHPDLAQLSGILDKTRQQALRAGRIIHRMREFVKSHSKHRSSADINTLIYDAVNLCIAELTRI
jgi:PAS domain S-box-containing protein